MGLFFELAEENMNIYNQVPENTLTEILKKIKNGFFTNGFFTLGDEELDTNRFFQDSSEIANFIEKTLEKYDNQPCIYYTGNGSRYFRSFKIVKRAEHDAGADEFTNNWEHEGENCYTPTKWKRIFSQMY